jgi:hypothetical protein
MRNRYHDGATPAGGESNEINRRADMPSKKRTRIASGTTEGGKHINESALMSVARSVGSTLGTVAGKAGEAAKELKTFSRAARKGAVDAARTVGASAEKVMHGKVAHKKTSVKKTAAPKGKAKKGAGGGK